MVGNHATKAVTKRKSSDEMPRSGGLDSLQSVKQRKVLDTVDKLRNCGLDSELSLPQLVVCGDQSAGKCGSHRKSLIKSNTV